ncbi:MAG TPA: glycosyltransferase family 2 protein [Terriglobia bacterium]|nr:glycosyltransferase family 2 protein [Terriglobia bacterium]
MGNIELTVIMPMFNERETVAKVVRRVLNEIPLQLELIIIDDGSTDGSGAIADALAREDSRIQVIHQANQGKTAALKAGFERSRGEIVIIQDSDLEYDPAEIPHVLQPILDNHADVVYGSRFLVRRASRVLYFYHYLANSVLTLLSNALTNLNMTDVETGYKALRGDIIRNMIIESSGFGVEIEITAKVAKLGAAVYEVPISYYGRTYEQGKKIGTKDGLLALWYILRFNLLCSLNNSFRTIPKLNGNEIRDFGRTPAGVAAPSAKAHRISG